MLKEKVVYVFCGPFDRVPRKVLEWVMRKKGIPEVLVRLVMSLYEGKNTRVRVDSELSEELEVMVGLHHGSVLLPLLFAIVVDVFTEFAREGVLSELLYAEELVLMSESMEALRNEFLRWKEAFESKSMKVNLRKIKVLASSGIVKDGLSKSNVDPCGVCTFRVMANSVLCVQCGKWIHGRCAGVEMVTKVLKKF